VLWIQSVERQEITVKMAGLEHVEQQEQIQKLIYGLKARDGKHGLFCIGYDMNNLNFIEKGVIKK